MTPITREEIDELERKAKEATHSPWEKGDLGVIWSCGDIPVCDFQPHVLRSGMRLQADMDYIVSVQPEAVLRLIARIRELESACVGMADRLEEYCGELVAGGMTKEAANIRRIWVTLREAAKGGA